MHATQMAALVLGCALAGSGNAWALSPGWNPMADAPGAPSPGPVVWDGTDMVTWWGDADMGYEYNPVTDFWKIYLVPAARGHSRARAW